VFGLAKSLQAAGEAMSLLIPRWGRVGRFLNPGPFNMKEHAAIVIMASSASVSATSTLVIAAQKLYYGGYPNAGGAVFITMSTQRMRPPAFADPIPLLLQSLC